MWRSEQVEAKVDDVDPRAGYKRLRGGGGGRLKLLLFVGFVLAVGAAVSQGYVNRFFGWWFSHNADAAPVIGELNLPSGSFPEDKEDDTRPPVTPQVQPEEPRPPRTVARQRAARPEKLISWDIKPAGEPNMEWFVDGRRPHVAPGCALRAGGNAIPALLLDVVQSEIGGSVTAEVSEDVYDFDGTNPEPIVPQGTRLYGTYNNDRMDFTSTRLALVWTEMLFTDGRSVHLADADGQDAAGSMGMGGTVTTQWGKILQAAVLLTVFDGISRGTTGNDDPSVVVDIQGSAGRTVGRMGRDITERMLDWRPKIRIEAGKPVLVQVRKTVQVC